MKTIKVASLFWLITLFLCDFSYAQNSVTLWNKGNVTIIENPDSVTFKSPNSNHNVRNITYWKNGISTVVNTPDSLFFWNANAYNEQEAKNDIVTEPSEEERQLEAITNDEEEAPEITYTEEEKIKYDTMAEELISLFGSDNDSPFLARKATNDDERAEEAILNNGVNKLKDEIYVEQQGWNPGLWGKSHYGGFETYYYAFKENGFRYLLVVFRHIGGGGFPNKRNAFLKVGQLNSGKAIGPVTANIGQEYVYIKICLDYYIGKHGCANFFPLMITEKTKARNYLTPFYVKTIPLIDKGWQNKYYGYIFGTVNGIPVHDNTDYRTGKHNQSLDYKNYKYQCVDLCARYIKGLNENIKRGNSGWGDAKQWPKAREEKENADEGKYIIFPNDGSATVREGDVIVWDHGDFGHVGVVTRTSTDRISIAHQNGGAGENASPIGTQLAVKNKVVYDKMPNSERSPIYGYSRCNITHFIRIYNPNEEIEGYGVSMNASTTKLDFRRVKTGERPNLPFTITNTGYLDLKISSVKISNRDAFSTDLTECIIKKGEERTFYVTFSPRNPENYEGRLLIESNAEDNYAWAITLLGTGYGDPLYKDLALSQEEIDMKEGESTTVDIISGNGKYSAYSLEDRYVSAYVPNGSSKVNITAVSAGKTSVVVKDEMSGDTKHIKVNVEKTADLTLSDYGPFTLEVGGGVSIDIDSGNGDYTAESDDEGVAKAYIKQKTKLVILATGPGNATITVSDKCGKTKTVAVSVNDPSTSDDVNLVKNGDMEGTDVSNFFVKINAGDINPAVISNGVGVNGSRGIKVAATARVSETWDNQFWVRLNRPVSAGTKYRFSFNYRADKSADVSTEYHAEPSEYIDWGEYITFTSAWKSYSKEGTITSSQSKTDMPFQSIAFTLNNYAGANNYYFDNIKFEVLTDEEEPPVDLKLSSTAPISLEVGEGATLEILSGNGGYNAKSDKENVATAAIKHETTVVIVATGPGEATITVSDKSGKTKKISVTVKDSSASGWINLVNNSDMEGTDVSSFYERTGTWEIDPYLATISNGVGINGSRGIKVEATQKVDEIWDNQFWVRFNQPISERTKYRFSFNYRADKNAEVREEFHAEPSEYLDWISDYINFTTNWQTFSQEGVVESNQSKDDMPFQSVAFTLNVFEGANNYYFDNIKFEVILDGQCPKPTFKLNGNKLTIQSPFTTRIYYTLDGTTPTTRSSVYTSPLALNQSCIVKAIAVVDASNISPVAAYTYSGEETFADLALSSTGPISMEVGESKTITITSGSGSYDVVSSASSVASVERSGNTITIKGKSAGTATITVTDTKTGQTMPVKVNVKSVEIPDASIIAFTDPLVKEICVKNWDTNGDGELSKSEAAAVTSFPLWAFASRDITSFNELQYFTGLKSIGWRAFESCSSLASIIIPNSVTSIEGSAFRECENLSSITIGNNVTSIGDEAFSDCYSLSSITIPNSVKSIGEYAFNECSRLASIIIPNSVTKIGFGAFFQCESLTSATIGNNVKSIEGWVFSGCEKLSSISIGNSVTSIGEEAFADCGSLTSFTIPNSVTTIGTYAFEGCEGLTSLTIGNSVTNIGKGAFRKCSSLISVTIPNSVKSIGDLAFQNCSNLTSIVIPNSVTSIGSEAFYECERLTSVTIPNSVTSIKNGTFKRCHNLSSITIPNSVTTIGSNAFYECHSLTSIVIPNSVTSIDPYAFYECKSLTSVTIPNSVKSIGNRAFEYCSGLTSITIGNSVTSFGYEAFAYCKNAETVISYIKEPFEIDTDVFQGLPKDATLFVPAGTKAKYGAFKGWTVIKNIVEMK